MSDTVDAINELCVAIDADMRAQREIPKLRLRYQLQLHWVQRLKFCPDWPAERVAAFAARRTHWVAADIAEDALDGHLPVGDAVWLLLQPGALPMKLLDPFIVSCAEHAVAYAKELQTGVLVVTSQSDWRQTELECRRLAVAYHRAVPRNNALVNKLTLAARAAGIAAWLLRSEDEIIAMPAAFSAMELTPAHLIARVAQHAALCSNRGPQPELLRQLKHLHALVT